MKQRLATALNMAIDYEAGDRAKSEIAHQLRLCFDYRISEWEFPMILAYGQDQISQVMQQAVANFKQHHQLKAAA